MTKTAPIPEGAQLPRDPEAYANRRRDANPDPPLEDAEEEEIAELQAGDPGSQDFAPAPPGRPISLVPSACWSALTSAQPKAAICHVLRRPAKQDSGGGSWL